MRHILSSLPLLALLVCAPALAQTMQHDHDHAMSPAMPPSPSAQAFTAANEKMHKDMGVALTGDADRDFVQGMIPHHQGAIDMARIELQYGADPEIKKIAQEIIAAQEKEIAMFKAWLARKQK